MGRARKPHDIRHLLPSETRGYTGAVFHVWCRAIDDMHVFPERRDKKAFLEMFERHLSEREIKDSNYRPYKKLLDDVEVLAFNVLDNHYHLVILQKRPGGLLKLMAAVLTGYGHYFNRDHGRRAQIFESPYSVRIAEDAEDVRGLIAYVHGNNEARGLDYEFSSHKIYLGRSSNDWLAVGTGQGFFASEESYTRRMQERFALTSERKLEERTTRPRPKTRSVRRGRPSHIADDSTLDPDT